MVQASSAAGWRDTLRRPTFWVVLVMLLTFMYLQWPTRDRTPPPIDYLFVEAPPGLILAWEAEPEYLTEGGTEVWALSRARMEFLVQRGALNQPLSQLAEQALENDRQRVNGSIREPLSRHEGQYRYSLEDRENRLQHHRLFELDGHWVKVSALYRSQNDQHASRAAVFFDSITEHP